MKIRHLIAVLISLSLFLLAWQNASYSQNKKAAVKEAAIKQKGYMNTQKAIFGAGCFWGVEETFRQLPGVVSTAAGFCGGTVPNPSYEQVCQGDTKHAEVVEVIYDPKRISYPELLKVFFANHDPTSVNRQGLDFGEQYRSIIFYTNPEQEREAQAAKAEWEKTHNKKVATIIESEKPFYRAEEHHQRYLEKRGFKTCH